MNQTRPTSLRHEELRVVRGRRTDTTITIALHSTVAGPATGGCRIMEYENWRYGVDDALRLSAAMTIKCALGGLPYGGGKTVAALTGPLSRTGRLELIADIADVVASFEGRYIVGPDIGTSPSDMERIHAATGGAAFCRPESAGGSGNSSLATARGVLAALGTATRHVFEQTHPAGLRVGVIGHGHVGSLIAADLAARGAKVQIYDIDPARRQDIEAQGMTWWEAPDLATELDVLIPAATGGLLSPSTAATCRSRLIVGPANNQTAHGADEVLNERGITWIPDVLASGGGVIYAASREGLALTEAEALARVDNIASTTDELLTHIRDQQTTPLVAAMAIANRRLENAQ